MVSVCCSLECSHNQRKCSPCLPLLSGIFISEKVPEVLLMAEDEDDLEIDPCALSPFPPILPSSEGGRESQDIINDMLSNFIRFSCPWV